MNKIFIGARIRKLRGKRSIKEFAKLCNISPKTVSNIENDKIDPRLDTIFKIAEGLNITPAEILAILKS